MLSRSICFLLLMYAVGGIFLRAQAQVSQNPWVDPRLVTWSKAINNGHFDEALAAVDADLLSPSPHPFSVDLWCRLHLRKGDIAAASAAASPASRKLLGPAPDLYRLDADGKYVEAQRLISSLNPGDVHSSFLYRTILDVLVFNTTDYDRALKWTLQSLHNPEPNFLPVWIAINATEDSRDFRNGLQAAFASSPALAASPAGTALQNVMKMRVADLGDKNCRGFSRRASQSYSDVASQWLLLYARCCS